MARRDGETGPVLTRLRAAFRSSLLGERHSRSAAVRGRSAALNQLLLCAVVLIVSSLALFIGSHPNGTLFLAAVLLVFAGGAAALVVPWSQLPQGCVMVIPVIDIVAIGLLRMAEPAGGLGLLWVFPAIWLATLGAVGFALQFVLITVLYWAIVATSPGTTTTVTYAVVLLPVVIMSVATTVFVSNRRSQAQQSLLDRQAVLLSGALQRAQRQEELMTEVLDAVDFGVLRIAPDGTVAVVNEALGRFQNAIPGFGIQDRELDNAYRPDGTTRIHQDERPLVRAIQGEVFDDQVVWFGHPDERRTAMSMTARRMRDAYGADAGAVLIARDVTRELTALRARDRLVASVSHELRTPLTSVLGYIDLALDNLDRPEAVRKDLEIAGRNGERLLEIVADILAASSSSRLSVDMRISPEDVDVADIVRACAEAWRPRAAERAVTIVTGDVEPARAFADPLRLRQVVDNLVSNAVKYNRDGGEASIGCASDGESTWIVVRDTGPGMTPVDQERLFERYFRARNDVEGTGLGLSISRDIARAHGGDITARSERGVGSTFIVRLPATSRAAATADAAGDEPRRDAGEART
ncbi:ATP-binding protein [Microbacterium sp. cx-55]|uniref:PAS domain-containing sensor histidine kinase n=1 Tax=unclassified Microbacterium TaxID=2609290 RepID=UPI001CBC7E73|nr:MULTISPECIES: PAS domain-containing sensor histidine kinase [unclassified Microbacterium]MBZ4486527.1 PAS domain-containing protein [Microbacterium sp. cx-55]MCC4907500.1 PAS domain-containing protein [Microbacterium sp. cx-59]UGB36505.1 ATP-binding protein [Microbacterium sp. cx-55]